MRFYRVKRVHSEQNQLRDLGDLRCFPLLLTG